MRTKCILVLVAALLACGCPRRTVPQVDWVRVGERPSGIERHLSWVESERTGFFFPAITDASGNPELSEPISCIPARNDRTTYPASFPLRATWGLADETFFVYSGDMGWYLYFRDDQEWRCVWLELEVRHQYLDDYKRSLPSTESGSGPRNPEECDCYWPPRELGRP